MSSPNQLFHVLLSSEIKGDLLTLFHKNPGLVDTIDGVARRIGRAGKTIDADIRDTVSIGVLGTRRIGAMEIIYLDQARDKSVQENIVDYLKTFKPKTE